MRSWPPRAPRIHRDCYVPLEIDMLIGDTQRAVEYAHSGFACLKTCHDREGEVIAGPATPPWLVRRPTRQGA
jgi:hypothetical protein